MDADKPNTSPPIPPISTLPDFRQNIPRGISFEISDYTINSALFAV